MPGALCECSGHTSMMLGPGTGSHLHLQSWETWKGGLSSCGQNTASGTPGHKITEEGGQVGSRNKINKPGWKNNKFIRAILLGRQFGKRCHKPFDSVILLAWYSTVISAQRNEVINLRVLITVLLVILTNGDNWNICQRGMG